MMSSNLSRQKFVHDNLGHAKLQLFDLTNTGLIKLVQNESDTVLKFVKLFD